MGRPKSQLLSSFGIMMDVNKALVGEVLARGGTDDDIRRIQKDAVLRRQIADLIVGSNEMEDGGFPLAIDYSLTVEQMVVNGEYDYVNDNINSKNFPITLKGEGIVPVTAKLVHYGKNMSSEVILKDAASRDLIRPSIEHGLAFGAQHQDEQRKYPIIILCEPWVSPFGDRDVPCLDIDDGQRELGLRSFGRDWLGRCRFLFLRA